MAKDNFWENWEAWRKSSLEKFNEEYGRWCGVRKFYESSDEVDPDDLVEFSENGSAYPHSKVGGTGYIPNAVPSFDEFMNDS